MENQMENRFEHLKQESPYVINSAGTPAKGGLEKKEVYDAINSQTSLIMKQQHMMEEQTLLLREILKVLQTVAIGNMLNSNNNNHHVSPAFTKLNNYSTPDSKIGIKREPIVDAGITASAQKRWMSGMKKQAGASITPSKEKFRNMSEKQLYKWCYRHGQPKADEHYKIIGVIPIYSGKPRIIYEGPNGGLFFVSTNQDGKAYRRSFTPQEAKDIRDAFGDDVSEGSEDD
jgi:hypothetical protein